MLTCQPSYITSTNVSYFLLCSYVNSLTCAVWWFDRWLWVYVDINLFKMVVVRSGFLEIRWIFYQLNLWAFESWSVKEHIKCFIFYFLNLNLNLILPHYLLGGSHLLNKKQKWLKINRECPIMVRKSDGSHVQTTTMDPNVLILAINIYST